MKYTDYLRLLPALVLLAAALTCCSSAEYNPRSLTLPEVPEEIIDPQQRADYLTYHYWDQMDFSDPKMALDTGLVEQSLVDFLDLLPETSTENDAKAAVRVLLAKAKTNPEAFQLLSALIKKYLYETESPLLNEDRYQTFVEYYANIRWLDEATRQRNEQILNDISRCRPGTDAPELAVLTDAGEQTVAAIADGKPAVLLLYDNDCNSCQRTIIEMTTDAQMLDVLGQDKLKVVAVDLGEGRSQNTPELPNWTWGKAPANIEIDSIYPMRDSTPSIYLIGPDGKILLKDISFQRLHQSIFHQ